MKLYLMRHGEALSPQVDPLRGLSERGKVNIQHLANHLKQQNIVFENIYHSGKKRAEETAHIMSDVLSPNVTPYLLDQIKPMDNPSFVINEINTWDKTTLIASHLPFVPDLITQLTGQDVYLSSITFETGTIVCLEKAADEIYWSIKWACAPSEI